MQWLPSAACNSQLSQQHTVVYSNYRCKEQCNNHRQSVRSAAVCQSPRVIEAILTLDHATCCLEVTAFTSPVDLCQPSCGNLHRSQPFCRCLHPPPPLQLSCCPYPADSTPCFRTTQQNSFQNDGVGAESEQHLPQFILTVSRWLCTFCLLNCSLDCLREAARISCCRQV